jgi:anti-sigma B factor antagonist
MHFFDTACDHVGDDRFSHREEISLKMLDIVPRVDGDTVIFSLSGEIDLLSIVELRYAFFEWIQAGYRKTIIDLKQITYIDSTGLSLLVEIKRELEPDGSMALVGCSQHIQRILRITWLDRLLPIFDSEQAARRSWLSEPFDRRFT